MKFRKPSILLSFLVTLLLLTALFSVSAGYVSAQSEETPEAPIEGDTTTASSLEEISVPILFVQNTCPHCRSLLEELSEIDLQAKKPTFEYLTLEISVPLHNNLAYEAIQTCNTNSAVPLLYVDGECFKGIAQVSDEIQKLAGLTAISQAEEVDPNDQTDDFSDISEAEGEEIDEVETEPEETNEGGNLSERLGTESNLAKTDDISPLSVIVMLIAPAVLIGIGYYLLKEFKL